MEASSPLAAMQAPSFMHGWGRSDLYTSHPHAHMSGAPAFGPGAFNFRDLSMKRSRPDYFSMRPVRGSSPTASLAADLSQNFHIDMRYVWNCPMSASVTNDFNSPQLPTPRRSLFTSNLFGTIDGRGKYTKSYIHEGTGC
jgi:M-phase inducer tyrosine phosphatase